MDANTTITVVAGIFAIVIVIGFIIYRRNAKVGVELPGSKLNFEGSNDTKSPSTNSKAASNGIFSNISIGKTRIGVKGDGTVSNNMSIGDTELHKENETSQEPSQKGKKKTK
jgi:hypothetical protein